MRKNNKLFNAILAIAVSVGGIGVLYTPISASNSLNSPSPEPAAVITCHPGYQEGFDVNTKWVRVDGDIDDVVLQNSNLYGYLDNSGDVVGAAFTDTFSGDFSVEVEVVGISGFDKNIDSLSFWMDARYDSTNYFGISSTSGTSTHTMKAYSKKVGASNDSSPIGIGSSYNFPITLKLNRVGSTLNVYYMMDGTYYLVSSLTNIITGNVGITLGGSMTTTAGHQIALRFDKFRYACTLPTLGEFEMNGGLTSTPVSSVVFEGKLYQFVGGQSSPNKVYMRATSDGIFDGDDAGETWVNALGDGGPGGETATEIGASVYNNRLYLAVKGRDSGLIYTKSMSALEVWDSTWTEYGGKSGSAIAMATFNPGSGARLYQVIKGFSSDNLYYRYTIDEEFDGSAANESWSPIMNQGNIATSPNAVALEVYNGRLYISVRGSSGNINYASTADGEFDSDASDEYFILSGGKTSTTPSMEVHSGKLYQTTKGNSTDLIYIRYFDTTNGWTEWFEYGGKTPSRLDLTSFNGNLYQTARGNSGNIFIRRAFGSMID